MENHGHCRNYGVTYIVLIYILDVYRHNPFNHNMITSKIQDIVRVRIRVNHRRFRAVVERYHLGC